ncbi:beta-hexosaminidase-like [Mercenaria mercenaria]|uniref:beta-hexosaminidase-like n=1 Tax=Mercenaria mercenaria TaxID=6596 RepID=UPI00234F1E70|nr:beta-hexosaminidase-like [Mercenaria mercenaria]XP_045174917.2 beta-hexosaminidase-like [Mercenaria mercenaria]XP_045174918.2 beta-hexosaminidase-like [Mercenaria mercenaria]XP_045174919.2 beta-hexosaminidase-like [Mercenaria mercenaria]XP_053383524.1 beta-hexosaminidase-like [Mercenaria mercenaria]
MQHHNQTMPCSRRYIVHKLMYHVSRNYVYLLLLIAAVILLIKCNSKFDRSNTGSKYSFSLFGERKLPEPTQAEIDYFAEYVNLSFAVEDNFISGEMMGGRGQFLGRISLANTGNKEIPTKRWQLYGYSMRLVEMDEYPYPNGYHLNTCGLKLFHVGGSLYRFEPDGDNFVALKPYEIMTCRFKSQAFQIARSDSMPRWYVTSSSTMPKVLENTDDEGLKYVKDFNNKEQYKRRMDDKSSPYSTQTRFEMYETGNTEIDSRLKIIPTPLIMQVKNKWEMEFNTNKWVIVKSDVFLEEVKFFSDKLSMNIVKSKPMRKYIEVRKASVSVDIDGKSQEREDAYSIETMPQKEYILITAATNEAVFYAFQTLSSALFTPDARETVGIPVMLPEFIIKDAPRFSYRGLHIDVSRNFIEIDEILKIIDVIAMYKMNKLHLHLSDDEGWRLQIPGIPELTQIGASRCHDLREEQCILPMLGSGPYSNTSGSGYYDIGDYREILVYAKERHVEIIPEFDMPGHSRAAIKSVHSSSQRSMRKDMKAESFSIIDPDDHPNFRSGQHFSDDVMNPCLESTYTFVKKIITEVKKMHQDIQPLKFYHFGGDEVADGAWDASPACQKLMKKRGENMSHYDLMKYFINNLTRIASDESVSVGAWEDGMISHDSLDVGVPFPRDAFKNEDIYVYVWKRPSERRTPHRTKLFANKGYKVILAYGSYLYFDHPYEPDPEERGLYWATRKISTRDAWEFTPSIMFNDKHLDCPKVIKDKTECFDLMKPENIMGMQAELWTETVRTNEQAEFMLFPRLLAVAERAWHKAAFESLQGKAAEKMKALEWEKFADAVGYHELPRLDKMGVRYRISLPGAVAIAGKANFNTEFPGLDIEYFSADTDSWKLASHGMLVEQAIKIRTRSTDGKRYSREVWLDPTATNTAMSLLSHNNLFSYKLISVTMFLYFTNILLIFQCYT